MSVLKPVLRSLLSNVLKPSAGATTRYFTPLDSVFQQSYAFAATLVSGTPITLTVYPTNGTLGLPPGAPAVTNNKWQVISYNTTGNVDNLGFDGVNYFDGKIWDYKAPSINVALALDENFALTTTAVNSLDPSGLTDATAIDITSSDLFTEQSNGDWLGEDLWTFGDLSSDGTEGAFSVIGGSNSVLKTSNTYRYSTNYSITSGSARFLIAGNVGLAVSGIGQLSDDLISSGSNSMVWQAVVVPCIGAYTDTTVKQLLKLAP